jgi:hypothetical protein
MGKKVQNEKNTKNKVTKKTQEVEEVEVKPVEKQVTNKTKKNEKTEAKKETKPEKVEKSQKTEKSQKSPQKKGKENKKTEKVEISEPTDNLEIKDEKIMNDQEEVATLEDVNKRYEQVLSEVKGKLNLDTALTTKAIKCLKTIVLDKYKDSLNILSNEQEEYLYLNFVLGKLPFKFSLRPNKLTVANSLYGQKFNTQVCLIVKDPRSDFKDLNIHKSLPFKLKVIDIEKLRLKFSRFQERRNLLKENELFLCDYKIYMMLKKYLGKPFYTTKKYPVPIKLDYTKPEEIKKEILSHVDNSTNFYMTHGPNYSVKIARAVSSNEEILDNIKEGVSQALAHTLKWGVNFEE